MEFLNNFSLNHYLIGCAVVFLIELLVVRDDSLSNSAKNTPIFGYILLSLILLSWPILVVGSALYMLAIIIRWVTKPVRMRIYQHYDDKRNTYNALKYGKKI